MSSTGSIMRAAIVAIASGIACGGAGRAPSEPAAAAPPAARDGRDVRTPSAFRDLVMNAAACRTPPRLQLTHDDARADAAAVERIVRRGWAGFETMSAAGVDFDALFAGLLRWIDRAPEVIGVDDFQAELVRALRPAADNHLAFFWFTEKGHAKRTAVGRHEQAYTADFLVLPSGVVFSALAPKGSRLASCEGHDVRALLRPTVFLASDVPTLASRPIVLAEAPPAPLHCTLSLSDRTLRALEIPLRRLHIGRDAPKAGPPPPAFELRDTPLPVVTLRSLWSGNEGELAAFVASGARLRDSKAIVVDVRGNGGGSDTYAKDFLAQLTSQTLKGAIVDRLDSDVTRQGIVNDNTCQIAEGLTDPAALRDANERLAYGNRVVAEAEGAGTPLRVWKPRSVVTNGHAGAPFAAPLVTLVDNGCASACESFVSHARQLEHSVVVGENSGGVGVFGEVLVYRLPKSGLGMTAGMKHFHDPDPTRDVPEGRGHLPDYWLDSDEPLVLSERIAECLAKPVCPLRP